MAFSDDSRWGEGVHTVELTFRRSSPGSSNETQSCLVYPYFDGINSHCVAADGSFVGGDGVSFGVVEYVRIEIRDESGWEQIIEINEPKYETEVVCRNECQVGRTSVTLTGPGGPSASAEHPFEDAPYAPKTNGAQGGAGGDVGVHSAYGSGKLGARCYGDSECESPYFCKDDFLGRQGLCTLRCETTGDCPSASECVDDILDRQLTPIDGYCLRPCDETIDCSFHGSQCNVQPVGTYCF